MGMIKTPLVRQVARGLARILGDVAQFCDAAAGGLPFRRSEIEGGGVHEDPCPRDEWLTLAALLRGCIRTLEAKL